MKLNENKTKIPGTFITTYIADAWDKISYIKSDIDQIKKEYSNTKAVVDILQDLADAYLILAGRLQAYADDKDYIELPDVEDLKENLELDDKSADTPEVLVLPKVEEELELDTDFKEAISENIMLEVPTKQPTDSFEYTCDFDDVSLSDDDADDIAMAKRSLGTYNF